ncbi:hypothetical protein R5R35_009453 [Gryllus longicercus]|uniref:Uncharacterized protein n=1 Tax=Gryllus longicercus TaxID=2509291 RepID=A0AAN9VNW8_9ORTH
MDDEKKKKCEKNREVDNKEARRRRWAEEEIPSAMTQVLILPRLLEGSSCKDSIRIEDVLQTIKEVWVEK